MWAGFRAAAAPGQRRRTERFRGHPRGGQPEFQAPVRAEFSHGADPGCESAAHSNTGRTEALGLVAAPDTVPVMRPSRGAPDRRFKAWPSYERCLQDAPPRHQGDRPDVSRADFTFCLLAIDWGWSIAETCARLLEKSNKAHENGEGYAWLTAQRAAAAVGRRRASSESWKLPARAHSPQADLRGCESVPEVGLFRSQQPGGR